jgi:endonuclease YncB( thermonuclease family)
MFKTLRKALIGLFLACLAGTLYYFLSKPPYQRALVQTAAELRERVQDTEKKPVWQGMVVITNVIDGDTVVVRTEQHPQVVVCLAGIDAPELARGKNDPGQPLAKESRDFLVNLLTNKALTMSIFTTDTLKRPVVLLTDGDKLINGEPLATGLAEVSEEYFDVLPVKVQNALKNAEYDAKQKSLGIWGLTNYQRPSEYRIRHPRPPN